MAAIRDEWQKKLLSWCKRQTDNNDADPLVRVTLAHMGERGSQKSPSQVHEIKNAGGQKPEDLCSSLVAAAHEDAEGLGGLQRYVCYSYYGEAGERKGERFTFRIFTDFAEDELGGDSEPANATGLVSQSMRHTEAIMRSNTMDRGEIIRHYQRIVDSLTAQVEKLSAKHFDMLTMAEEMTQANHERKMDAIRVEHEMINKGEVFRTVKILLPTVVNKLAGKNLLPTSETPSDVLVDQLLESLDPQQVAVIQQVLKPQQLVAFAGIAETALTRKEQREKKDKEAKGGLEVTPGNGKAE